MLGCQQLLPAIHAQFPARVRPYGRPGDAATPTRSTRTPLVVRPPQCRVETPTLPDTAGGKPPNRHEPVPGVTPSLRPAWRATSCTIPPRKPHPREGQEPADLDATCLNGQTRLTGELESVPRLRMGTPTRRILGQGPHHPPFREEERDPPHPRCLPSVRRAGYGTGKPPHPPDPAGTARGNPHTFPTQPALGRPQGWSAGHRRRGQGPFRGSIQPTGGRDEP